MAGTLNDSPQSTGPRHAGYELLTKRVAIRPHQADRSSYRTRSAPSINPRADIGLERLGMSANCMRRVIFLTRTDRNFHSWLNPRIIASGLFLIALISP